MTYIEIPTNPRQYVEGEGTNTYPEMLVEIVEFAQNCGFSDFDIEQFENDSVDPNALDESAREDLADLAEFAVDWLNDHSPRDLEWFIEDGLFLDAI